MFPENWMFLFLLILIPLIYNLCLITYAMEIRGLLEEPHYEKCKLEQDEEKEYEKYLNKLVDSQMV